MLQGAGGNCRCTRANANQVQSKVLGDIGYDTRVRTGIASKSSYQLKFVSVPHDGA